MRFIFASDSFKGSLSSEKANATLERAARDVFGNIASKKIEIADGGEGTLEAIQASDNEYEEVWMTVSGPLGEPTKAFYIRKGNQAVIEMAKASGLPLVKPEDRNPLYTITEGTGELMRHALQNGCTDIYVAIGGSATNDGGIGAMIALGYRFLDAEGNPLAGIGKSLKHVSKIDDANVISQIKEAKFTVMCDVTNPLTGPKGATHVFGPQKGAVGDILTCLEDGMLHYQAVVEEYIGKDISKVKGLGAAGGLGGALYAFLGATMKSGIDVLLDLCNFESLLADTDLVVTGEGKTDFQSAYGKVIYGIAKRAKAMNKPVFVISGALDGDLDALYDIGVAGMMSTVCKIMDIEEAMEHAEEYLYNAAKRLFSTIKAARTLLTE